MTMPIEAEGTSCGVTIEDGCVFCDGCHAEMTYLDPDPDPDPRYRDVGVYWCASCCNVIRDDTVADAIAAQEQTGDPVAEGRTW